MRFLKPLALAAVFAALLWLPFFFTTAEDDLRPWLTAEALLLAGLCLLLPRARRWSAALVIVMALLAGFCVLMGVADAALRQSLSRTLNLTLDVALLSSVDQLLVGNFGRFIATAAEVTVGAVLLAYVGVLALLLGSLRGHVRQRAPLAAVLLVIGTGALLAKTWQPDRIVSLSRIAIDQVLLARETAGESERFALELARDPVAGIPDDQLFSRLKGVDVIVAFVESYGSSAIFDPRYAPRIAGRLHEWDTRFAAAGLHAASTLLVSPTVGGQSWLPETTLLSGLWIDSQLRYDLLTRSQRSLLPRDFRRAGHISKTLRPGNTLTWPEGPMLGYQVIVDSKHTDYAGPPLNWVTMPDQFVWSYLQRALRAPEPQAPTQARYIDTALISSHAPWTPVLPVLDWNTIGNGAVFQPFANAGPTPTEVWSDDDRVRQHYAMATDYALNVIAGYAERHVDDHTLLILMGDHQPAPLVSGDGAPHTVPMHVISRDPALVQRFIDGGFVAGSLPNPKPEAVRMDRFREWFVRTFSGEAGVPRLAQ